MPDGPDQYQSRIHAYTEGKDFVAMQAEAPQILAELVRGIPVELLTKRPAPGKWSICEIIAHLAEDELTSTWRYRQMIENPSVVLAGFDQDLWAKLGDYNSYLPDDAVQMFRLLRKANVRMLGRLTPEQWASHGVHVERGQITVRSLARHMAGHDCNHFDQIRGILGRKG